MSKFTSVMLFISGFENEQLRLSEVNTFLNKGREFSLLDVNDPEKFPDAFPRSLYVGTYNYFDTSSFLLHLKENVNWEYPQYVQVFVQEEEDYTMKVFSDAGSRLALDSYKETDE